MPLSVRRGPFGGDGVGDVEPAEPYRTVERIR